MQVHVLSVPWAEYGNRLSAIRGDVFVVEQQVPQDEEWDGQDDNAHHFMALNEFGQDLGCARLLPSGQIGRMAVLKRFRGQGLGSKLLNAAVKHAQDLGMTEVHLHAQEHALEFYRRHEFLEEGEPFEEAGIRHRMMRRMLALPVPDRERMLAKPASPVAPPTPAPQASAATLFSGETEARRSLVEGLGSATRQLAIFSHHLDPAIFDKDDVVLAISEFARRAKLSDCRILLYSSRQIVSRGHRLIDLARRLPSKIDVKVLNRDDTPFETCFAVWDDLGYWLLPDYREPGGVLKSYDPVRAKRLTEQYDALWQRGVADPNLRNLRL